MIAVFLLQCNFLCPAVITLIHTNKQAGSWPNTHLCKRLCPRGTKKISSEAAAPELNVRCGCKKRWPHLFSLYIFHWRNTNENDPVFIFSRETLEAPQADYKNWEKVTRHPFGSSSGKESYSGGPLDRLTVNTTAATYQRDNLDQVLAIHMHLPQAAGPMSLCVCVCVCAWQIKIKD